MASYLIDVNLPYYFSLWHSPDFVFVRDLNDEWKDSQIWQHALEHNLIIVTKDTDFFDRVLVSNQSPKVIHISFGNMLMKEFFATMSNVWPQLETLNKQFELIRVYKDKFVIIK